MPSALDINLPLTGDIFSSLANYLYSDFDWLDLAEVIKNNFVLGP